MPPLPHIGNGEVFEGDEVVGVEGLGHDGGRILYLGVITKEKAPPPNDGFSLRLEQLIRNQWVTREKSQVFHGIPPPRLLAKPVLGPV